jgi:hypothetical protein
MSNYEDKTFYTNEFENTNPEPPKSRDTDSLLIEPEDYSKNNLEIDENTENIKNVPFWYENPNIIFNPEYIFEFFPTNNMSYSQKMNAATRTVLLLTVVGFIITQSVRLLIISIITIVTIYVVYTETQKDKVKNNNKKQTNENYQNRNVGKDLLEKNGLSPSQNTFSIPSQTNPLSNVLVTDYDYNPNKKPAPPSYNTNVNAEILNKAKQLVTDLHPDQPNISDKLFKDLGEQFTFEQSLQPFYSTANTMIPNDQASFADFCYGSMVSCKEGNMFACARNLSTRHTN